MAHRTRTKSKARTAAAVDADMASLRREREGLAAELAGMRAERDRLAVELEMMRYSKELVGKEPGADPDNLTNSEKTRVVVHLAAVFGLRHSDLLERVGVCILSSRCFGFGHWGMLVVVDWLLVWSNMRASLMRRLGP